MFAEIRFCSIHLELGIRYCGKTLWTFWIPPWWQDEMSIGKACSSGCRTFCCYFTWIQGRKVPKDMWWKTKALNVTTWLTWFATLVDRFSRKAVTAYCTSQKKKGRVLQWSFRKVPKWKCMFTSIYSGGHNPKKRTLEWESMQRRLNYHQLFAGSVDVMGRRHTSSGRGQRTEPCFALIFLQSAKHEYVHIRLDREAIDLFNGKVKMAHKSGGLFVGLALRKNNRVASSLLIRLETRDSQLSSLVSRVAVKLPLSGTVILLQKC